MAKLSDHEFPESVWKAFGEHVVENDRNEEVDLVPFTVIEGIPGLASGSPNNDAETE